jgi:hypothetical protein
VAEKALDSCQSSFHVPACLGHTSFEVQLAAVVGHSVGNRES